MQKYISKLQRHKHLFFISNTNNIHNDAKLQLKRMDTEGTITSTPSYDNLTTNQHAFIITRDPPTPS